jgi:hypothetical protein
MSAKKPAKLSIAERKRRALQAKPIATSRVTLTESDLDQIETRMARVFARQLHGLGLVFRRGAQ